MQRLILKIGFYFIGLAGVLIGLSFILFGVNSTGQFFAKVLSLFHTSPALKGLDNPNADSELRFYSVFWIAYGVLLIQTARDLTRHAARIPWLIALFFIGGVARLFSFFAAGQPHDLFTLLMIIELGLPIILFICWRSLKKTNKV